jgi:hypothetical protein
MASERPWGTHVLLHYQNVSVNRCAATVAVLACANLSEHEQQIILSTSGLRASDLLHLCGIFDTRNKRAAAAQRIPA